MPLHTVFFPVTPLPLTFMQEKKKLMEATQYVTHLSCPCQPCSGPRPRSSHPRLTTWKIEPGVNVLENAPPPPKEGEGNMTDVNYGETIKRGKNRYWYYIDMAGLAADAGIMSHLSCKYVCTYEILLAGVLGILTYSTLIQHLGYQNMVPIFLNHLQYIVTLGNVQHLMCPVTELFIFFIYRRVLWFTCVSTCF
jgi:hypothetical protein